ncbi:MAG: F0F1 ATP synthase subunit B [Bacteroidales bacterium]|nr:F0F1 ATP synthase subunit B [Bacteroidales bacterium]
MGLITPDYGLLVWMLISFGLVLFVLKKFAWKPIMEGLKSREETISKSLRQAEEARNEIKKLQEYNEELAEKARAERELALKEAKSLRDKIVEEAKAQAQAEAQKIIEKSKMLIIQERENAQKELAQMVSKLALEITEKILRKEFSDKDKQIGYFKDLLSEISSKN